MTVVAWDGRTLAADRRSNSNGLIGTVTKVRRIGPLLCAGCGEYSAILAMLEWIENGRVTADLPAAQNSKDDWACMLVIDGARILKYDRGHLPMHLEVPFYAVGTGRDFAIAAMHLGKSASEAVEIASLFQSDCGNGVDVLNS